MGGACPFVVRLDWWWRWWGFLCCPLELERSGVTADVSRQFGGPAERTAIGRPRPQVPKDSYRVTGMGRTAGSARARPLREGQPGLREAPGAGHGPGEREVLGAHSLTRFGYSFSTQPPHIPTPFSRTVLHHFREDETSR